MEMQLCALASNWNGALPDGGAMLETKIDGWRALRFRGIDGVTRLWSRNGQPLKGAAHIAYRLDQMEQAAGEPWFFDGEVQVGGTLAATKAWFESGWKLGGEAGVYHLFDGMPLAQWRAGGSDAPLYERKKLLKALWDAVETDPALSWEWRPGSRGRDEGAIAVQMVADEWVTSPADALDFANRIWTRDGEGAMLKAADAPYRRTRSAAWQKIKPGGPWWKGMRT